ncbi:hypothetical protein ACYZTL_03225 [Pseudomonas sp. LB3P81]
MEIHSHVTPSLHPQNISAVPGYNEDIAPHLASAVDALDTAYQGLNAIHKARKGAATNPTMNDAGRLLVVADFAEKHQHLINRKFDYSMSVLKKNIDALETMLNTPLVQSRADGITAEIRAHVKGLSVEARHNFLNEALENGDKQTLGSVLGAPAYLSGISQAEQQTRTRMYHRSNAPEAVQRLEATKAAYEMLGRVGGLVHTEIEKAMGASWSKVNDVRTAKQRAEAPFK